MPHASRTLITLCLAAILAPAAVAADAPQRKSGLWEIKTSTEGTPAMTMQVCVDQRQDDFASQRAAERDARQRCPKMAVTRSGRNTVIDSVCLIDKVTATSHAMISGDLASQYRMESTTRYTPPMHGMARSHMVMEGRWLGPCKAGQKHGDVMMPGLPGGGQFAIDPEALRQMQKLAPR